MSLTSEQYVRRVFGLLPVADNELRNLSVCALVRVVARVEGIVGYLVSE